MVGVSNNFEVNQEALCRKQSIGRCPCCDLDAGSRPIMFIPDVFHAPNIIHNQLNSHKLTLILKCAVRLCHLCN